MRPWRCSPVDTLESAQGAPCRTGRAAADRSKTAETGKAPRRWSCSTPLRARHCRNSRSSRAELRAAVDLPGIEPHAVDDTHLVAILQVPTDALQDDARRDSMTRQLVRRTDSREHQELRRVERTAGQHNLPCGVDRTQVSVVSARRWMRAIQALSLQVLDANRPMCLVEDDPRRQRMQDDAEAVGVPSRNVEQAFTSAATTVSIGRQWQISDADRVPSDQPPVVRIEQALEHPAHTCQLPVVFAERRIGGRQDDAAQLMVAEGGSGNRPLRREPAVPAMTGSIQAESREPRGGRACGDSSRAARSTAAWRRLTSWRHRSCRRSHPNPRCAGRRESSRCARCSRRAFRHADSRCLPRRQPGWPASSARPRRGNDGRRSPTASRCSRRQTHGMRERHSRRAADRDPVAQNLHRRDTRESPPASSTTTR